MSRHRRPIEGTPEPRLVVIAAFDGVQSLDVAGPYEVFVGANALVADDDPQTALPYDVRVVSIGGPGLVTTESGLRLGTEAWPDADVQIDTLVVPGGQGVHQARRDEALIAAIGRATPRRLATVCTGTFLAAEAGLLDGRTVTTHWARAQRLAAEYPAVCVDPDPIYRRDGDVWTSAGVTAGIDLCLALVDDDRVSLRNGSDVAQTVARWLVMFRHRPGGQSQFAVPVWAPRARTAAVRAVQEHIERDPGADHRLDALAVVAHMSARHLTRVFTDEVGETPARYVELVRIDAARVALENTDDTLDVVAHRCGFGTAETLRRTFHRHLAVAPDQYRRRFHTRTDRHNRTQETSA